MKNYKVLLCLAAIFLGGVLSGCMKEVASTQYATQESFEADPSSLYNAMKAKMVEIYVSYNGDHWDFGYPSWVIMSEQMGQDVVSKATNYDRFMPWSRVQSLNQQYVTVEFYWNFFYTLIKATNSVIALPEPSSQEQEIGLASAYVYRAFAYFNLANIYQYTYKGNESKPAVPIVLETTTEVEAGNNPRASVQKVYELILSDLTKAEALFPTNYKTSNPADVDLSVLQGVAARVYLSMENWGKARDYAAEAKKGYSPLTQSQFQSPTTGFNDINSQDSWIWALDYTTEDDAVQSGIINWTAHMSNEYAMGYAGDPTVYGAHRMMGASLYKQIPANDWRKSSWLDKETTIATRANLPQYASLKFRPYGGDPNNSYQACDFPLMRVEEMMLIEAEATAMAGDLAEGKALLDAFLALRSTGTPMTCVATTEEAFQDEVWIQRRIELWGEGFSFIDIKRLGKSVIRSYPGTNFVAPFRYNSTGVPYWFLAEITRGEEQGNEALKGQNNPNVPTPQDIDPGA